MYPDLPAPVACAILVGLFTLQHHGTKRIGCFFAPIIITWLLFISGSGLYNIIHYDAQILRAVSPVYMLRFLRKFNLRHGKLLSSTVLCIAGSISTTETILFPFDNPFWSNYSFWSRVIRVRGDVCWSRPLFQEIYQGRCNLYTYWSLVVEQRTLPLMQITFICFVYPVLLLTYAGQAAFVSKNLRVDGAFHLSESIPNSKIRLSSYVPLCPGSSVLIIDNDRYFRESGACICCVVVVCFGCRKPSNHYSWILHHTPVSGTWLFPQSKSCSHVG